MRIPAGGLRFGGALLLAALGAAAAFSWTPVSAQGQGRDAIGNLALPGESLVVSLRAADGTVRVAAAEGAGVLVALGAGATAGDRAVAFVTQYAAELGMPAGSAARTIRVRRDELGLDVARLQQTIGGVPVTAGELNVHLRGDRVVKVMSELLAAPPAVLEPAIAADAALETVRAMISRGGVDEREYRQLAPRLEVFNRGLLDDAAAPTRLAWFVETLGPALREFTWIDAVTGARLLSFNQLPHARNRLTYTANNAASLPGTLIRNEASGPSGNVDVDLAHTYGGDTYDYFFTQHGRDSFDGAGATIVQTVDFCPNPGDCPYANAFWDGTQMVYGDGFPAADDVVAHELTHAVTEYSANLFYFAQSGALNESFSDIFGETIDLSNTGGTDTPGVRWKLGEDVPGFGAIRDMMNPGLFGDPAKVSDPAYVCNPYLDGGGVHINSGVPNHAYALMVDGGTYNGVTVSGIGLTKAAKIHYRALTDYLTSGSNLRDHFYAVVLSCFDLIGTAGIVQGDCAKVQDALDAVELRANPICGISQLPNRLCPSGTATVFDFGEELDDSLGSFAPQLVSGGVQAWLGAPVPGYSAEGRGAAWGQDLAVVSDSALAMTSGVLVQPNTVAGMLHAWSFDWWHVPTLTYYDGGVIEYSTNAGASWNDASPFFSGGQGYNGTVSNAFGNPIGGRSAFVHSSLGYTITLMDLSSLAGQTVRLRYRVGSDTAISDLGWLIDAMAIWRCVPQTSGDFTGSGTAQRAVVRRDASGMSWLVEGGSTTVFGLIGETPVAADYDGDGDTDIAVFRDGLWRFPGQPNIMFGQVGDIPVVADYDGDGRADLAVYRRSTGQWINDGGFTLRIGGPGSIPVPADLNGDGWDDPAVFQPSTGTWVWQDIGHLKSLVFGQAGDIPVPADYTGDGIPEIAVFRPSNGFWYIHGVGAFPWGQKGDIPVPLNMLGDKRVELVVFRPGNGNWYAMNLGGGSSSGAYGQPGDLPAMLRPLILAPTVLDNDSDLRTDPGVFRPGSGTWYLLRSSAGFGASLAKQFGVSTDIVVPGEYNRDGRLDLVVFRPSTGVWYFTGSPTYAMTFSIQYGQNGDVPVYADFNGDGRGDFTVFRPSNGTWYSSLSAQGGTLTKQFGANGDIPVPADFDYDGKSDMAVYRPSTGTWYVLTSGSNFTTSFARSFGASTDIPVPMDVDGDRRADIAVYRPSTGIWYWLTSVSNYTAGGAAQWGTSTDVPVPGDYDGDGVHDIAVWRPSNGFWYVRNLFTVQWGSPTDVPIVRKP